MDFNFPSKIQLIPILLIIPIVLTLKSFIKNDLPHDSITKYKIFSKYIEIFFFMGFVLLSIFDKLLAVFSLLMFFLYSLDQSIRLISLGIKNIILKKDSKNIKIIVIGLLILIFSLFLSYFSIKNIK
ncbi:MAG: hypothetical protein U0354_07060 [Candidatus Sericytochromatia bacterium]